MRCMRGQHSLQQRFALAGFAKLRYQFVINCSKLRLSHRCGGGHRQSCYGMACSSIASSWGTLSVSTFATMAYNASSCAPGGCYSSAASGDVERRGQDVLRPDQGIQVNRIDDGRLCLAACKCHRDVHHTFKIFPHPMQAIKYSPQRHAYLGYGDELPGFASGKFNAKLGSASRGQAYIVWVRCWKGMRGILWLLMKT